MKISFSDDNGKIEFTIADRVLKNENMTNRCSQFIENILKLVTTNLVAEKCDRSVKCLHNSTQVTKKTDDEIQTVNGFVKVVNIIKSRECVDDSEPEKKFRTVKSWRSMQAIQVLRYWLLEDYNNLAKYIRSEVDSPNLAINLHAEYVLETHLKTLITIVTDVVFRNENLSNDKYSSILNDIEENFVNKVSFNLRETPWKDNGEKILCPDDIVVAVYLAINDTAMDLMTFIDTHHYYNVLTKSLLNMRSVKFGRHIDDINVLVMVSIIDTLCFTLINALLMVIFKFGLEADTNIKNDQRRRFELIHLKATTLDDIKRRYKVKISSETGCIDWQHIYKFAQGVLESNVTKKWTSELMSQKN